ncbi:MAG: glycoside hydrolase domain-containing protein, partial [bacterium]
FDTSEKGGWGYGWNTPFGTVETPYLIGTREGWDDRRWIEAYRKQVATKDPAARDALDGILKQAIAKRTDKGKDTVNDFYAEMAGYERMDVWRARLAEALAATLTLHPASAMVRLSGPSGIALPPKADTYTVEAAGGEVESFQVAVRRGGAGAPADAPLKVQVEIRAKPDPAADPMKQKAVSFWVSLYQVMDVNYKGPAANDTFKIPPGNEGWIPDVCLPLATSGFAVEAQAHNPGQVTLLVEVESVRQAFRPSPSDTYELTVKEAGSEFPPAILTLTLRQRKVVLPARLDFMTGVTWNWNIEKYLGRELTPVERSKFIDFFLRHRLTPASFFSRGPSFSPEELRQIAGGAPGKAEDGNAGNIFQLFHIGGGGKRLLDDKAKTDLEPKLRDWRKTMQDAGALDFCYALIGDECPPEAYPMIRANALWLKSVFPELKIWLATRPVPDLLDVVDAWDVVTAHSTGYYSAHSYTPEGQALARGAPGKPKCWWFYSVEPYGPHPNCRIDNALADSRAIGWLSFTKGMDGFEYFWATDWAMNEKLKAEPYPGKAEKWDLGLSGAGQLCYPVEVAGQCVPAASLRLVNLRDAMEDWALFRLAGNAIQKEFAGEIRDPETLAKVRQRALDLLENSQK